ncbi:MAG: CBS domain-containing protein, partial [Planctomycetota bacterium]
PEHAAASYVTVGVFGTASEYATAPHRRPAGSSPSHSAGPSHSAVAGESKWTSPIAWAQKRLAEDKEAVGKAGIHLAVWLFILGGGFLAWRAIRWRMRMRRALRSAVRQEPPGDDLQSQLLFEKRRTICRVLANHIDDRGSWSLCVRHLMSERVCTVGPNTDVDEIRRTMHFRGIRHLLVTDGDRLLGIISDRDVAGRRQARAYELMTPDPLTVAPDSPVGPAVTTMLQHRISCLPVVENGKVCGVLTTTDLALSLQSALQILQQLVGGEQVGTTTARRPTTISELAQQQDGASPGGVSTSDPVRQAAAVAATSPGEPPQVPLSG